MIAHILAGYQTTFQVSLELPDQRFAKTPHLPRNYARCNMNLVRLNPPSSMQP